MHTSSRNLLTTILAFAVALAFCGSYAPFHNTAPESASPIVSDQPPPGVPRTMLVILGNDDSRVADPRVMQARMLLAQHELHPSSVAITVSGNTKKVGATTLGEESRRIGRSLRGSPDGLRHALYREPAANNTAQNLVCTAALWKRHGLLEPRDDVYLITSNFACPRLKAMLNTACRGSTFRTAARNASLHTELSTFDNSFCPHRKVSVVAAEDPPDVKWRAADEKYRYMPNVFEDLLEALRGLHRGYCHTPPPTTCTEMN